MAARTTQQINAEYSQHMVDFRDHSAEVLRAMTTAIGKALTALGMAIVETVDDYLMHKYGKSVYLTGDLLRSISFNVDLSGQKVIVGSNLDYAIFVFLGTAKMPARPALQDAILNNIQTWDEIVQEHLGAEFSVSVNF